MDICARRIPVVAWFGIVSRMCTAPLRGQDLTDQPKFQLTDRLLWVWLSRLWSSCQDALEFVQPRTVLAWQKKHFRDYWRRLSQRGKPSRPAISKEVREFIKDMWRSKPT
jgi:hypothetical protein